MQGKERPCGRRESMPEHNIEVAVSSEISNTERGNLLVDLMCEIFDALNYKAGPPIIVTGMEVDITAVHNVTNEEVYTECKAHRDKIPEDVLSKLLGNVVLRNVQQGWLITTSSLSKDAEGWKQDWEKKPIEERRRLQIYTPDRLLALMVASNRIVDPRIIGGIPTFQQGNWYLLLTNYGRYWVKLTPEAGIPSQVSVYDAKTGGSVSDTNLLEKLKATDTTLRDFNWVAGSEELSLGETAEHALSTVVDVAVGDAWTDYRPARPEDFVGREELQSELMEFFHDVSKNETRTRLFSIRGPSGWGKSSLIAKLRDRSRNLRNRRKLYITAVDMRAANSANYVSAALIKCFSAAIQGSFILPPVLPLQIGPPNAPLDTDALKDCLQQLQAKKKVVVLIFDQFEEVLTKPELRDIFDRLRQLSLSVDTLQENLILGFAWKSDALLPQEHPAYYLWHQLKDRRHDIEVPRFASKDVSQALTRFQSELKQRLNPILRSQLIQHCQGFPWLLKKLCIHVLNLIQSGSTQPQILERGLDVRKLFDSDLSDLSSKETLCLREIARLAPVEWVQIVDQFGNDTYTSLLDKRLIVRSGDRLNPYWDIFRDYLRTSQVPNIPISFLPSTEVRTLARAAAATITRSQGIRTMDLSRLLSVSSRSVLNVIRDLQMFALADKKGDQVIPAVQTEVPKDAGGVIARIIASTLSNHVLTIQIRKDIAKGTVITEQKLLELFDKALPYTSLRDDTKKVYALRLAKYLSAIRILEHARSGWVLADDITGQLIMMPKVRGSGVFLGDAPPERVLELLNKLSKGPIPKKDLTGLQLRNALASAIMLGLVRVEQGEVITKEAVENPVDSVLKAARQSESVEIVSQLLSQDPQMVPMQVGTVLAEHFNLPWSDASKIRRGNALKRWTRWVEQT